MAKRWAPNGANPIGSKEPIGRRLYEVPRLAGTRDKRAWKDVLVTDHFLETRGLGEISLDRLGRFSVDGSVKSFLIPSCHKLGTVRTPPKQFDGWIWLRAESLIGPPKGATGYSPIVSPEAENLAVGIQANPYHAHVCRLPGDNHYATAVKLRALFHDHGDREQIERKRWLWVYAQWCLGLMHYLMRLIWR